MGEDEVDTTPDDVLDQPGTTHLPPPADLAPDDARERIRRGDVIWGLTPNGNRYLQETMSVRASRNCCRQSCGPT